MKKEKQMMLPNGCTMINSEEMQYIEGGKAITIKTQVKYLSRTVCIATAKKLKKDGYCTNMSVLQVAQEIKAHAVDGYGSIPASVVAIIQRQPALVVKAITTIGSKGLNGISLGDNCDKWYRVAAYMLVW